MQFGFVDNYYHMSVMEKNEVLNVAGFTQSSSDNKYLELENIYKILSIKNIAVLEIAHDVLQECFKQSKADIVISRTGEGEVLIYTIRNGEYHNIIIDSDADIEYLYIPLDRRNTVNEYYSFININESLILELVSKL